MLERNERLGGCTRTEEITLPGFKHAVFSAAHPIVISSPAFAALEAGLTVARSGLGCDELFSGYPNTFQGVPQVVHAL